MPSLFALLILISVIYSKKRGRCSPLTEIIVAVISGAITLIGVMLQFRATTDKMSHDMQTSQAVMNTKLEELTREVRSHNNFAQRMPVVEEQIRVINHRIADLEKGGD